MKGKFLFLSALTLSLTQTTFADNSVSVCPAVNAIAAVGIESVIHVGHQKWIAGVTKNQYQTNNNWAFGIGVFDAKDTNDALHKALADLPLLFLALGPISTQQDSLTLCVYTTITGHYAFAFTPTIPLDSGLALSYIK